MATWPSTEKLDQLGARYDELTQQLSTSEVASDSARYQKVAKQHAELEEIVEKHREYKQLEKDLAGAHQMFVEAEDAEMKQMAHDEERELTARKEKAERDRKSTRLNSSHANISYAVFCLKKKSKLKPHI